jgi:hypothetical protein
MAKWEYYRFSLTREKPSFSGTWTEFTAIIDGKKMDLRKVDEYIDALGKNGWELVSVTPISYQSSNWLGMTDWLLYYFKRELA